LPSTLHTLDLDSWLLPFVGHLGIVTSDGLIHDFAGPYTINVCTEYVVDHHSTMIDSEYSMG